MIYGANIFGTELTYNKRAIAKRLEEEYEVMSLNELKRKFLINQLFLKHMQKNSRLLL